MRTARSTGVTQDDAIALGASLGPLQQGRKQPIDIVGAANDFHLGDLLSFRQLVSRHGEARIVTVAHAMDAGDGETRRLGRLQGADHLVNLVCANERFEQSHEPPPSYSLGLRCATAQARSTTRVAGRLADAGTTCTRYAASGRGGGPAMFLPVRS